MFVHCVAVKCNDDPMLLQTLAVMGTGYDCVSRSEIHSISKLGVDPPQIIYANLCKQASHNYYQVSQTATCGIAMCLDISYNSSL